MAAMTSVYTHFLCAMAYLAFAAILPLRSVRTPLTVAMSLASLATAAWAGVEVAVELGHAPAIALDLARTLHTGSWLAVTLTVLYRNSANQSVWRALVAATAFILLLHLAILAGYFANATVLGVRVDTALTKIAIDILGLILIENMVRNFARDSFWSLKFLAIALGAVFGYQLLASLPEFLTHTTDDSLLAARPIVQVLVLPLLALTAVRDPAAQLRIHSSRRIVFHAATLIAAGVLFEGTAIAAFYLRNYGGDNGTVLAVALGTSCVLGIAVALTSASVRARLRSFISENFFSYKYDYRFEWTKFIRSMSALEEGEVPLRVLRTLAEILESPGGALWSVNDRAQSFDPSAKWSCPQELTAIDLASPKLGKLRDETCVCVDLMGDQSDTTVSAWRAEFPEAWLLVPMRYRSDLIAIALVGKPRIPRKLDWEDRNLIELVALQLAGYLVQDETARALTDARQLEDFNKRFAFILHDIKNTIGQLDLLVRNAQQFGDNEDFRKDMDVTLRNAVDKLQRLLAQLKGDEGGFAPPSRSIADLSALVRQFVQDKRSLGFDVLTDEGTPSFLVALPDKEALLSIVEHVFDNAVEASANNAPVSLQLYRKGETVCVAVSDTGRGMTQDFIRRELFRPLHSTKEKGFGIGAYQAREIIRGLGGDLEVKSKPGSGTTVTIMLPLVKERAEAIAQ